MFINYLMHSFKDINTWQETELALNFQAVIRINPDLDNFIFAGRR